ncbi:MAG: toprim domain-containing protein [Deltaproteobacteria bacterium]|nr:toprim domain-containing protein [Nannocystaceae bacterium]
MRPRDVEHMPDTGENAVDRLARAVALAGTPGAEYVERRGIPLAIADAAGVRFDPSFAGRAAVIVAMRDRDGGIASVHGRYLQVLRGQDKMLTVGRGGGAVAVQVGWRAEPLVLVEGMFDALALATCGWSCVATIGRWAPWLVEVCAGRTVWLAFDAARSGELEASRFRERLVGAEHRSLAPPGRSKDWSTALVRHGRATVSDWLRSHCGAPPR